MGMIAALALVRTEQQCSDARVLRGSGKSTVTTEATPDSSISLAS